MEVEEGRTFPWLATAAQDFVAFAAARRAARVQWDVPATELWYVDGVEYLGTVMLRHELTPS